MESSSESQKNISNSAEVVVHGSHGSHRDSAEEESGCCKKIYPTNFCWELRQQSRLSFPLILAWISFVWMQPIATMFGGHLEKLELDVIALSNTLINVFGNSIVTGLVSGCDTFFAQTYGSENKKLLGIHFQRSLIVISLAIFPCYAIHLNIEALLILVGQDPEVARLTGRYLLVFIPGTLGMFLNVIVRKYLECQAIITPNIVIGAFGLGLHALAQYLFLFVWDWGIEGSALAQALAYFSMFVLTVAYILVSKVYKTTWSGWDIQCLVDWKPFVKLSLYGMVMMCLEWWAFEVSVIIAGLVGSTELAAQSVIFNINIFFYPVVAGFGTAAAIRAGHALGAGDPHVARGSSRVGMAMIVIVSLLMGGLFAVLREQVTALFTSVEDVADMIVELAPMVAIYLFLDGLTVSGRGVVRGIGKQGLGTTVMFVAYYLIAFPVGVPLLFLTSMGLLGLWIGFLSALAFSAVVYFIYISCVVDWGQLSLQARVRAGLEPKDLVKSTNVNETTPLLTSDIRVRSVSKSSTKECESVKTTSVSISTSCRPSLQMNIPATDVTPRIIFEKIVIISCFVSILAIGILCRCFVDISESSGPDYFPFSNSTDSYTSTIAMISRT